MKTVKTTEVYDFESEIDVERKIVALEMTPADKELLESSIEEETKIKNDMECKKRQLVYITAFISVLLFISLLNIGYFSIPIVVILLIGLRKINFFRVRINFSKFLIDNSEKIREHYLKNMFK